MMQDAFDFPAVEDIHITMHGGRRFVRLHPAPRPPEGTRTLDSWRPYVWTDKREDALTFPTLEHARQFARQHLKHTHWEVRIYSDKD